MDDPGQDLANLEGRELMIAVRRILVENPERHDQGVWVGNYYLTPDELSDNGDRLLPVDEIRPYAMQPIAMQPEEPNAPWPVCGSTGCVAGWAAVLAAPPGSFIRGWRIVLPGGAEFPLDKWAASRMGISSWQAAYLFNPNRGRERLIRLLDALIEDPGTELELVE